MRNNKKILMFFLIVIVGGCFLYYNARFTYTAYESIIEGAVTNSIAGISLKINGVDAVANNDGTLDNRVILDNTTWVSTHTREEKISPGSSGTIDLEIDPSGSDVAILYEFIMIVRYEKVELTMDSSGDENSESKKGKNEEENIKKESLEDKKTEDNIEIL